MKYIIVLMLLSFFLGQLGCAGKQLVLRDPLSNQPKANTNYTVSSCCKKGKTCQLDANKCTTVMRGTTDTKGRTERIENSCKGAAYFVRELIGEIDVNYEGGFNLTWEDGKPRGQYPYKIEMGGKVAYPGCTNDCGDTVLMGSNLVEDIRLLDDYERCELPEGVKKKMVKWKCYADVCAD